MKRPIVSLLLALTLALGVVGVAAHAGLLDKARQKAKEKLDAAKDGGDKKDDSGTADASKDDAKPAGSADAASAGDARPADPPGKGVWLNYDFVPGERTIYYEDFSGDDVGDFPHRMELASGNFEVVDLKGRHCLRTTDGGEVTFKLPEALPQRFTIELEFHEAAATNPVKILTAQNEPNSDGACDLSAYFNQAEVSCGGTGSGAPNRKLEPGGFSHVRFTVDGNHVKGYAEDFRSANLPAGKVVRSNHITLEIPGFGDEDPTLIASIRIAEGGKKLYEALAASGRVATHGIQFDTGSDRIRPESTPTLKEIGDMLTAHADLKLLIEGHTDDVGEAAANQALSGKRAAAVKAYLVSTSGISGDRLETQGFGAAMPAAPNTTAEGRQINRRVELVRR